MRGAGNQDAIAAGGRRRRALGLAAGLLLAGNLLIYGQAAGFGFVNYDDEKYVTKNAVVRSGLNARSLDWGLRSFVGSHWHPLTWYSHMLDCQLFGLAAGGHHMTSVAIHVATTLLLLLLVVSWTGDVLWSGLAAALWSFHPLRVESVVWVAERKDVLSALFFVLALAAYTRYARAPSWPRYLAALGAFAGGILAKPMIVTLPFVLLLLDVWPLGRSGTRAAGWAALVLEKAPFFALSAAASVLAVVSQGAEGALRPFASIPFGARLANAVYALGHYIDLTVWPRGLAVFYPFESPLPGWKMALSLAVLAAVTAAAIRLGRARPALCAGWLWYLGTLVPVIGLVQVGAQAFADRYTYVPSIGLLLALVFGIIVPLVNARPARRRAAAAAACVLAAALLAGLSWRQARHWRDSIALFGHAISVTKENGIAHYNLGCALAESGRIEAALPHYREAVRIRPDFPPARHNLGITLLARDARDARDEGVTQLREAVRLDPAFGDARLNLGVALAMGGRLREALPHLEEAAKLMPRDAVARYNLGLAQDGLGRADAAIASYREAVSIDPGHAAARFALAGTLAAAGRASEALAELTALLKEHPRHPGGAELLRSLGRAPASAAPAR